MASSVSIGRRILSAIGLGTTEDREPDTQNYSQDYMYNEEEFPMPARERESHYSSSRGYNSRSRDTAPQDSYTYDDPQEDTDYEQEDYRSNSYASSSTYGGNTAGKILNHPANIARHRMLIYQLSSYEDTRDIIDDLLEGHSVLINLERMETEEAQRIVDTLIGACYAINATIKPAAAFTYLLAPESVDVAGTYAPDMHKGSSIMDERR